MQKPFPLHGFKGKRSIQSLTLAHSSGPTICLLPAALSENKQAFLSAVDSPHRTPVSGSNYGASNLPAPVGRERKGDEKLLRKLLHLFIYSYEQG